MGWGLFGSGFFYSFVRQQQTRVGVGERKLADVRRREQPMKSSQIVSDPETMGGTPVFVGTRVPVRILFEHLEAGDSLEIFLEDFPSVSRAAAVQVLQDAKAALVEDAHPA